MTTKPLRVGLIGTSWWADAMYLPALAHHSDGAITMVCGRNPEQTAAIAARWKIGAHTTDWREVIDSSDAVIVAGPNDTHVEMATAALQADRHILCEKPVGLNATEARTLAELAATKSVTTLVPYTYRWMPAFQWAKRLIDDGYIGRFHHINLRYHTGYALNGEYAWRFDRAMSGSGVIGDLGSHWLHYARWWCGEVSHVGAVADALVDRAGRLDGSDYERCEDSALITVRFAGGGHGVLQVSAAAYEGDGFGQTHTAEIHGSEGTLHVTCDWRSVQEVRGLRRGDPGGAQVLPIPDDIWAGGRREFVKDTYHDVFRTQEASARLWLSAAARGERCAPDLTEGARVQELCDAAVASAASDGRLLPV